MSIAAIVIILMTATGLLALAGIVRLMHIGETGLHPGRMIIGTGLIILSYLVLCAVVPDPFGPGSRLIFGIVIVVAYLIALSGERRRYRRWQDYKPIETKRARNTLRFIVPLFSIGYVLSLGLAVFGGGFQFGQGHDLPPSGGRVVLNLIANGRTWPTFVTQDGLAAACPIPSQAGPASATVVKGVLTVSVKIAVSRPAAEKGGDGSGAIARSG